MERPQAGRKRAKRESVGAGGFYTVFNVILFWAMSELAYVGVIFYTDVLKRCTSGDAFSFWIFIFCPLLFCLLCFGLLRMNRVINRRYPISYYNAFKTLLFFVLIGLAFWGFNYLLYVAAVASSGNDGGSPFVPTEPIWLQITLMTLIQLVIMCLISLNQAARFTIGLYRESEALKQAQARAEIRALQTQLNPHFLFNSLNTLISEIDYDPVAAKKFTIDLAGAYRYILQVQDKPLVPVYEELGFLRTYVRLNQIRVGESLSYRCMYPDQANLDFLQYRCLPSLSLQLLAENALKHNVVSSMKPLEIQVGFSQNLDYLIVSNNVNPKKSVHSLGTGLKNLSERYRLLAGKEIIIERTPGYFRVKLPMLDGNETR